MATPTKFYKYMTAKATKAVLQMNALRWSATKLFNDPFDLQFDLHMEFDSARVVARLLKRVIDIYMDRTEGLPGNKFDESIRLLRKNKPKLSELALRNEFSPIFHSKLKQTVADLPKLHEELKAQLAERKLLCFSEEPHNLQMWSHYAEHHTGAVIELSCIEEGEYASAWGGARQVKYMSSMPLLADDDAMFLSIAQQKSLAIEDHFYNSVYVKAQGWAYEREWRVLGGFDKNGSTEDIPFRPKELTAVYLGCRMSDSHRNEIREMVKQKFAHAPVKAARKAARRFALEFVTIA